MNLLHLEEVIPSLPRMVERVSSELRTAKAEGRHWTGIRRRATLRYPNLLLVLIGRWLLARLSGWLLRFGPTAIVSNFGKVEGLTGPFAGVVLSNMRVLGSAFSPLTLNTFTIEEDTCVLSFCVRKSHFLPEMIDRFASEMAELVLEGE
jgi:hypothetical protein